MNALAVVKYIIVNNSLESGKFHLVRHAAQINWRQINDSVEKKLENAESGILFDKYIPIEITGSDLLKIDDICMFSTDEKPLISISSKIKYQNIEQHMLMMNIHLEQSLSVDKIADSIRKLTDSKFWILKTDRFYHVYALGIADEDEWRMWNLKFLMLDSLVSPRFIGHSLERGFNLLRLNKTDRIKVFEPLVIYCSED